MAQNATGPKEFDAILESEHPWSSKDIGSNSISSMIQETTPTGAAAFLSGVKTLNRMDNIPPIPPVVLRRVQVREFEGYLSSIADVIDKFQLHKAQGPSALEGIPVLESESDQDIAQQDKSAFMELERLVPLKIARSMDRLNRTRILSSSPQNLKSIPDTFSGQSFDLQNPDIFSQVVGYKDIVGSSASSSEVKSLYRQLTDQLTLYQDTIEVQLLQEISRRSASFFSALENLQQLEKEAESCVSRIDTLRASLALIRETNIKKGLQVIRLKQTRSDLSLLYGAVKLINQAKQSQPIIKVLLAQKDFIGALDLLEEASAFLVGKQTSLSLPETEQVAPGIFMYKNQSIISRNLDLRGVGSVSHLSSQLEDLSKNLSQIITEEFKCLLLKDLQAQLDMIINTPFSGQPMPSLEKSKSFFGQGNTSIRNILNETYSFSLSTTTATPVDPPKLESPPLSAQDEVLRAALTPLVFGLLRLDRFDKALNSYKDELIKQLKQVSKQHYPKLADPPSNLGKPELKKYEANELAKQLKSLSFDAFYGTLVKIYIFFLRSLQRAAVVNDILVNIIKDAEAAGIQIGMSNIAGLASKPMQERLSTVGKLDDDIDAADSFAIIAEVSRTSTIAAANDKKMMGSKCSMEGPLTFTQILADAQNILFSAIDIAHVRCAKFIAVRQEQNAQLNPKDFYRLFNATWEFLTSGEQLCGKMCFGLKGSILAQAKSFVNYFHEEKSKQIALLLDNEQWMQADIPVDFQNMVEQIIAMNPPPTCLVAAKIAKVKNHPLEAGADDEFDGDMSSMARRFNSSNESLDDTVGIPRLSSKYLTVDGRRYFTVGAVLMFLKSLTDYVQCAKNMPSLTPEILNRIYEFLKLFNSRTCQLILGSAAIRSAGLQSITAKHIALTAQSLGLVMALTPYIRSGISQYLNPRQQVLLQNFDRIIGDYRNHQNELYLHLVNIMTERLITHAENLLAINWDTPDQKDFGSDGISMTMSTLVKETCSLHIVLAKYLSPESLKSIMTEIFRSYVKNLEEKLKKVELFSSAGKNRLLTDAHYFTENLSRLEGVSGPGSQVEVCVNNIRIKDKRAHQPVPKSQAAPNSPQPPPAPQPPKSTFGYNFGKILRND